MKTTFKLDKPKVKLARQIESTKSTINKYLKRERKKQLPTGVDFWDFACKFGESSEDASSCHLEDLTKLIDQAEEKEQTVFYVEIVAKEGFRNKRKK